MARLIEELQKDCLNSKVPLTELLRKALFIAQKLKEPKMIAFCESELKGYSGKAPDYRFVSVSYEIHAYGVCAPYNIPENGPVSVLKKWPINWAVCEMEHFLEQSGDCIEMNAPYKLQNMMREWNHLPKNYEIKQVFSKDQLLRIFENIRTEIITWASKLVQERIFGEDYDFSTDEKEKVRNMSITNNFNAPINGSNIVATATNSTLNVNNTNSFDYEGVKKLLESVQKLLPAGNFAKDDLEKIQQDIDEIRDSISKQNVPAVKGKLKDLAVFCKGIAGNVIASGVWAQIQPFLC